MTWAYPYILSYLGEEYELVQGQWLLSYVSRRYEIDKHWNIDNSAMTHNFVATFEIESNQLYLTQLDIPADKCDLKIGDVSGEIIYRQYRVRVRGTSNDYEYENFPEVVRYSPVKEELESSGYMVIVQYLDGRPFPPPYYPHKYKKLLGMDVVDGKVKEIEDFAQEAEEIRAKFNSELLNTQEKEAIAESFRKKVFRKS
jgi:hypothetical protein